MSATQELIAAALTAAEVFELSARFEDEKNAVEALREACARAMVQPAAPDMAEVERLLNLYDTAWLFGSSDDLEDSRTALLDYVRGILAERDALIADNERLSGLYEQAVKGRADMRSALREARAAAPQPVGEFCTDYHCPGDCGLNGHGYQHAPQPVGAAWHLDESETSLLHQLTSPDDGGDYSPLTLRVGHVREDDGTVKFGLLCEYTDYPEEGATLLVERSPAPQLVGAAEVPMPEPVEQLAITRYHPVPNGMFGYKVVAGDGTRSVFEGTKSECTLIARKLTEAFLDGAHVAGDARVMADKLTAELAACSAALPGVYYMDPPDGGANPHYDGLFDGETDADKERRIQWAINEDQLPWPGMMTAFENYYGQSWFDRGWRDETAIWAAAWKAAKTHNA